MLGKFISNLIIMDYYQKYIKYKKKYLNAKIYIHNQKGSASFSRVNSRESLLPRSDSSDSLSNEIISKASPRSPYPIKLDRENRPVSVLSEQIHESDENNEMLKEDKNKKEERHPIYLTGDYKENDIFLTIYTMAFNLLRRFEPLRSNRDPLPSSKFLNCIKEFFEISKNILISFYQEPFLKLNQRDVIFRYKENCKILNKSYFRPEIKKNIDKIIPTSGELINYNKSLTRLYRNIESGLSFIKVRPNIDEARQKLVNVLK